MQTKGKVFNGTDKIDQGSRIRKKQQSKKNKKNGKRILFISPNSEHIQLERGNKW